MAPKADKNDKKVKGKKSEIPPAVRKYENKECQTEPEKCALKYLCCGKRNDKPKPAASDSMSIVQRICSWFPCFCCCSKTRGGKSAEQTKPCLCVRNDCSDGELANSIEQLKIMAAKSGLYPLTVAELSRGLHGPNDEIEEEVKSNKSKKKDKKKPKPKKQEKEEKQPDVKTTREEKPAEQRLTKHHKADCPCASRSIWTEFLRPPKPKKRCRHCNRLQ